MSEIIFRGRAVERGQSVLPGVMIALGIGALVFFLIGLLAGKRAPAGMEEMIPYFGAGAMVFLGAGLWRHYSIRSDLFVTRGKSNTFGVTILGKGRKKIVEFFSPFELRMGYEQLNLGRGKKMNQLYMVFQDENGKCLLSLESTMNGIYGVPEGWKTKSREQMGEMTNAYMCSHMSELSKLLRPVIKS